MVLPRGLLRRMENRKTDLLMFVERGCFCGEEVERRVLLRGEQCVVLLIRNNLAPDTEDVIMTRLRFGGQLELFLAR